MLVISMRTVPTSTAQTSMEQWPRVESIQKLFPWSATVKKTHEMVLPRLSSRCPDMETLTSLGMDPNQIEILLGLSGEGAEKGYWREPPFDIKGGIHDQDSSTRRSSEGYICHG
jgi:hypothetical protein